MENLDFESWRGLLQFHSRITSAMSATLQAETGLTLPEYELLLHLYEQPAQRLPMSELARLVLLTPSGITRMVDRLLNRKFVERQSVRNDARVQHAVLTPAGQEAFEKASRVHNRELDERFLSVLQPSERDELVRIWTLLLARIGD